MSKMKNIQVIDSALNCTFSVFVVSDQVFASLFPNADQDIAFIEEVESSVGEDHAASLVQTFWNTRIDKKKVNGIHGTLFFGMKDRIRFFPNRKESDGLGSLVDI